MVTPETLKPMNLLVETGIVDGHVVDGGLVDEHVVDAWSRRCPRSSCRSAGKLRKKVEGSFSFRYGKMCVHTGLVYRRRERWSLCGLPTLS
jgi:hypothetical protein